MVRKNKKNVENTYLREISNYNSSLDLSSDIASEFCRKNVLGR